MRILSVVCLLLPLMYFGQTGKSNHDNTPQHRKLVQVRFSPDTNIITILSNKGIAFFSLDEKRPDSLTTEDLRSIENLLNKTVAVYNKGLDSNRLYSGYIRLTRYKRQYIPYINAKGERKVFVNCFCTGLNSFPDWKTKLVVVEDGGRCFFNATLNLSAHAAGPVLVNGPA